MEQPKTTHQTFKKHLSEPWFSLVKLGIKISEGRVNKGIWRDINRGDKIIFTNNDMGFERKFHVKINDIGYYPDFHTYLEREGLPNCLPGMDTMNLGVAVYRQYYTVEEEQMNGVKSFRF